MSVLPGGLRFAQSPTILVASNQLVVSDTAYFVYMGYVPLPCTPKYVRLVYSVAGAGAQTAEVGLFSTPQAPNRAAQSLTKIVATGTLDSLTAAGPQYCKNTNAFAALVPSGTHLWAGFRAAMATTQPTVAMGSSDWGQGGVLTLATAGALTAAGPFAGGVPAIPAAPFTAIAPLLRVTLD